jgi:glucans biosynthesis protein
LRTAFATCCCAAIALISLPATSASTQGREAPFSAATVQALARSLAKEPFVPPKESVPQPWANISYDQYRDIRFRRERAIWRGERRQFELHLLPTGWLFKHPVAINIVEDGIARPLAADNSLYEFGPLVGQPKADTPPIGFSGLRINAPINHPNVFDEVVVFQGASYFRAVSRGQAYGLSARGLAIDVAQPNGEEFPLFRTFWVEQPLRSARQLTVHALLDSPGATGAYTFRITGGAPTVVDVSVMLFPRRDLQNAGLAPLTSMFLFSGFNRSRINDFRRAVHDSNGLAIATEDERIWRPLTNPTRLQVSAFSMDGGLRGFGLVQRRRLFSDYEDLEANYEQRPSAWVEPIGDWGKGTVRLVEIPSEEEIHDNIVAYWSPLAPLAKDQAYSFAYRISWPADAPRSRASVVRGSLSGPAIGVERKSGGIRYAVDFAGPDLADPELPKALLSATAGKVSNPVILRNPSTRGARVDFMLMPGEADVVELRLELRRGQSLVSEVWLSRWTK